MKAPWLIKSLPVCLALAPRFWNIQSDHSLLAIALSLDPKISATGTITAAIVPRLDFGIKVCHHSRTLA